MTRQRWWLVLCLCTAALGGCGGGTNELKQELDEHRKRPGAQIEPLPPIQTYESYSYDPAGLRSPFTPSGNAVTSVGGPRPDARRNREFLENYPLDTLKLVGTLRLAGHTYALLQTRDGLVHRVLPGNHVGQSDGRITAISDTRVDVLELVADGSGNYVERPASITLSGN